MNPAKHDLIVIGGGPAGEKDAAQAAYFGKRVALTERAPVLGGTVANTSIPFKALRETALYLAGFQTRGLQGVDVHTKEQTTLRDFLAKEQALVRDTSRWSWPTLKITTWMSYRATLRSSIRTQ